MIAIASAPPSTGSVPAPASSSRTSDGSASAVVHRHDVRDVRGERAEARRDRLLVADVGEHGPEHGNLRAARSRNQQAGLRHQRQQSRGLQRDGLAAGVRPGDDEHADRRNQHDVHGNRTVRMRVAGRGSRVRFVAGDGVEVTPDGGDQQRMTRATKLEAAIARDAPARRRRPEIENCARACSTSSSVAASTVRCRSLAAPAEGVGQRQQDAADFFGLLLLERDDVVVDFDGAQRLEKQARAAAGAAVDDSRNRRAVFRPDDEHIASRCGR